MIYDSTSGISSLGQSESEILIRLLLFHSINGCMGSWDQKKNIYM